MSISNCRIIKIPSSSDFRGKLAFFEGNNQIPFEIRRIYYIYDVPINLDRGNHAHKNLEQVFIAINGSFDIEIDDGKSSKVFHLNSKNLGLYICPMIWRKMYNFSPGAICIVIASERYQEEDYIWDHKDLLK